MKKKGHVDLSDASEMSPSPRPTVLQTCQRLAGWRDKLVVASEMIRFEMKCLKKRRKQSGTPFALDHPVLQMESKEDYLLSLEQGLQERKKEMMKDGRWPPSRKDMIPFTVPRKKLTWDHCLEEMRWMAADFERARRLRDSESDRVAKNMLRYHIQKELQEDRRRAREEERMRKKCNAMARIVKQFWKGASEIVRQRSDVIIESRKVEVLRKKQDVLLLRSEHLAKGGDADFIPKDGESEDEMETFQEEIEKYGTEDYAKEADRLQKDAELSLEEVLKKRYNVQSIEELAAKEDGEGDDEMRNDSVVEDEDIQESHHLGAKKEVEEGGEEETGNAGDNVAPHDDTQTTQSFYDKPLEEEREAGDQLMGQILHSDLEELPVPELLDLRDKKLRVYQKLGLDWLFSLHKQNMNGILADEMGLGKTIQTIALFAHLASTRSEWNSWGPHLIVVPSSVIVNWEMEFHRWLPGFKVVAYYGSIKERKMKRSGWSRVDAFNVCITSYQLAMQDQSIFRRKKWNYLVLDEAHHIKNFKSRRWQVLLKFPSAHRLLLTGTPIQNSLVELWSLMHFLMPHMFESHSEFREWFEVGVETKDEDTIRRLHSILGPFMLRRLKCEVEKELPLKYEHTVSCPLSRRQKFLYEDFISRSETKRTLQSGSVFGVINILMQLRKVCNHPDLFESRPIVSSLDVVHAGKYDILNSRKRFFRAVLEESGCNRVPYFLLFGSDEESRMSPSWDDVKEHVFVNDINQKEEESQISEPLFKLVRSILDAENDRKAHRLVGCIKRAHELSIRAPQRRSRLEYLKRVNALRFKRCMYSFFNWLMIRKMSTIREDMIKRRFHSVASDLVKSVAQRSLEAEPILKGFAFAIPKVRVAFDFMQETPSASLSLREMGAQKRMELLKPLHLAMARLNLNFPDKKLIQYDCGKFHVLSKMLPSLRSKGHRALIFTQMTRMLDVLESFLSLNHMSYLRLDGSTGPEQRQILVERFNRDERVFAFILTTRTGGLGLNLIGADTVIFYDSDWNPAMDAQAQDRCHRIGQTRDVHIYRLVSESTVEENIIRRAKKKQELSDIVMTMRDTVDERLLLKAYAQAEDDDDRRATHVVMNELRLDREEMAEAEIDDDFLPVQRYAIRHLEAYNPYLQHELNRLDALEEDILEEKERVKRRIAEGKSLEDMDDIAVDDDDRMDVQEDERKSESEQIDADANGNGESDDDESWCDGDEEEEGNVGNDDEDMKSELVALEKEMSEEEARDPFFVMMPAEFEDFVYDLLEADMKGEEDLQWCEHVAKELGIDDESLSLTQESDVTIAPSQEGELRGGEKTRSETGSKKRERQRATRQRSSTDDGDVRSKSSKKRKKVDQNELTKVEGERMVIPNMRGGNPYLSYWIEDEDNALLCLYRLIDDDRSFEMMRERLMGLFPERGLRHRFELVARLQHLLSPASSQSRKKVPASAREALSRTHQIRSRKSSRHTASILSSWSETISLSAAEFIEKNMVHRAPKTTSTESSSAGVSGIPMLKPGSTTPQSLSETLRKESDTFQQAAEKAQLELYMKERSDVLPEAPVPPVAPVSLGQIPDVIRGTPLGDNFAFLQSQYVSLNQSGIFQALMNLQRLQESASAAMLSSTSSGTPAPLLFPSVVTGLGGMGGMGGGIHMMPMQHHPVHGNTMPLVGQVPLMMMRQGTNVPVFSAASMESEGDAGDVQSHDPQTFTPAQFPMRVHDQLRQLQLQEMAAALGLPPNTPRSVSEYVPDAPPPSQQ
eukprot:TRINITY_DN1726_c0_g1_i2.p1 TRINITY_DN1726_c0_g1~~TRINITY_DN1726_c0_g1_i2.p1  ORF type:complete len:1754 (+),score=553.98 TRINITY_DN1726_c0_g1_i2:303-5564(+)